jgi:hypothetical protein
MRRMTRIGTPCPILETNRWVTRRYWSAILRALQLDLIRGSASPASWFLDRAMPGSRISASDNEIVSGAGSDVLLKYVVDRDMKGRLTKIEV